MKLSFLFNFIYFFHQKALCLCLFLTNTCPVTVCPVTPVLIRLKQFPLLAGSSPLKPFALLISTLSVENRLREKFPAGCICVFAHLAISREVNRATQQFQHLCGVEPQYLHRPHLCFISRWWRSKQGFHSWWTERIKDCFHCLWSIWLRTSLPRIHSLLEPSFFNRNYSLIPPFQSHLPACFPSYPSALVLTINSLCECLLILLLLPSDAASTLHSLLHLLLYPAACLRAAAHTPAKRYLIISILSAKAFGETVY